MSDIYHSHGTNPILKVDLPDPDVIFYEGAFYMITTSMHYMPGAEILRSYDLINWEHLTYVYDVLDETDAQKLKGDKHIYGKGMWAASLRHHEGVFYVAFVCNDTQKTYLYRSRDIEGPWQKSTIAGFYHDCSLLFDDGKAYIVYGNTDIYITELNTEMTAPAEGGLNRLLLSDAGNDRLGYEGSHIYKINGKYYLFLIHSRRDKWKRVEACFVSDSLTGEFSGGDIFEDNIGFRDSGVAQGAVVEGPEGVWNAVLFQDRGAIGRIPVLVPACFDGNAFTLGVNGKAPLELDTLDLKPGHEYEPLSSSDDFRYDPALMFVKDRQRYGCFGFKSIWQFNHEPDPDLINVDADQGKLHVKTDKTVSSIFHAKNILTQKMTFPECAAEVTIDGSMLNDGDTAGLAAFQGDHAFVGLRKKGEKLFAVMVSYTNPSDDIWELGDGKGVEEECIELKGTSLRVRLDASFGDGISNIDIAKCYIFKVDEYVRIGTDHKLRFRLDHFTGCRFGLFVMSEKRSGGTADFSDFVYHNNVSEMR